MGGHVRPRAGSGGATGSGGEEPSGGDDVVGVELAPFGDVVERERVDGLGELAELADPTVAELVILQAFLEHDADHPGEQRRVLTGPDLQVDVGEAGQLGAARVDDDELHALGLAAPHDDERVGALEPADRRIGRDHRVVPDRHVDVGVGEVVVARLPSTEAEHRQALGRLVDGDRRVERHRVDALVEGTCHRDRHRVLIAAGAGVRRHGARPVGVDDAPEFGGDLVECLGAVDLLERAVGASPQWLSQAASGPTSGRGSDAP